MSLLIPASLRLPRPGGDEAEFKKVVKAEEKLLEKGEA